MVQRYEQTRKLQWYKRGAAYPRGFEVVFLFGVTAKACKLMRFFFMNHV